MKIIKHEYTPIRGCQNFLAWLWFTVDYPYGSMYGEDRANWFKYCGSDFRVLIRRRFGFSWDVAYHRTELGFLHVMLTIIMMFGLAFLGIELMLIWLMNAAH